MATSTGSSSTQGASCSATAASTALPTTMPEPVRKRRFPIVGHGDGVTSFVHLDDAAAATVLALGHEASLYNVVDDEPALEARVAAGARRRTGEGAPARPRLARAAARRRRGGHDRHRGPWRSTRRRSEARLGAAVPELAAGLLRVCMPARRQAIKAAPGAPPRQRPGAAECPVGPRPPIRGDPRPRSLAGPGDPGVTRSRPGSADDDPRPVEALASRASVGRSSAHAHLSIPRDVEGEEEQVRTRGRPTIATNGARNPEPASVTLNPSHAPTRAPATADANPVPLGVDESRFTQAR